MTHDSAVRTIVKLAPEIEKSGAEKVLRDYAEREDLPVAQLEKLAQVYNTLRTVTHIEHANDRGESFDLVDVPTLVVGYASGEGGAKSASSAPVAFASHAAHQLNLKHALQLDLAGPKETVKAAAAPEPAKPSFTMEDILDTALDLEIESRLEMSKLAADITRHADRTTDGELDLAGPERDAVRITGSSDKVKAAAEWLSKAVRADFIHHDFSVAVKAASFGTGSKVGEMIAQLAEAVELNSAMQKFAQPKYMPGSSSEPPEDKSGGGDTGGDPATPKPPTGGGTTTATRDMGAEVADALDKIHTLPPDQADQFLNYLESSGAVDAESIAKIRSELEANRQRAAEQSEKGETTGGTTPSGGTQGGGGGGGGGKGGGGAEAPTVAGGLSKALHIASIPVRSTMNAINASAAKADEVLTRVTSKERTNKAQRNADVSVEDIRRAINLRRMIGTDPVLREADPKEVLEIYNSISRVNPEVAGNMAAMKLLLREAVSYEGLTLDAQKQLADIRRSTADAEGKEEDNSKRRYSVGGSLPISVAPKMS